MEGLKNNSCRIFSLKQAKFIIILLIFVLLFDFSLFHAPVLAAEEINNTVSNDIKKGFESGANGIQTKVNSDKKDQQVEVKIKRRGVYLLTAYSSEVAQTDDSPCITANGFNVCSHGIEDTIAANFLPFGAKVKMPELFGDRVFVVRDRMNARHSQRVDIWMLNKADAKKFGVKLAKIEVLEQ